MKQSESTVPKEVRKTSIGGQALIEGLMMIGPHKTAMAVILPDKSIALEEKPTKQFGTIGRVPLLRGSVRLFSQIASGIRALSRSADLAVGDAQTVGIIAKPAPEADADAEKASASGEEAHEEKTDSDTPDENVVREEKSDGFMTTIALLLGVALGVGLFILLPNYLTTWILNSFGLVRAPGFHGSIAFNLLEGVIRITVLVAYMWLISRSKDIARTWQFTVRSTNYCLL